MGIGARRAPNATGAQVERRRDELTFTEKKPRGPPHAIILVTGESSRIWISSVGVKVRCGQDSEATQLGDTWNQEQAKRCQLAWPGKAERAGPLGPVLSSSLAAPQRRSKPGREMCRHLSVRPDHALKGEAPSPGNFCRQSISFVPGSSSEVWEFIFVLRIICLNSILRKSHGSKLLTQQPRDPITTPVTCSKGTAEHAVTNLSCITSAYCGA
jgi:hypothetical protein